MYNYVNYVYIQFILFNALLILSVNATVCSLAFTEICPSTPSMFIPLLFLTALNA